MKETRGLTSGAEAKAPVAEPDAVRYLALADVVLLTARMLEPPERWDAGERQVGDADVSALALASGLAAVPDGETALSAAARAWEDGDLCALGAEHARLFEGAVACPCNETVYIRRDKGVLLADIAGFYRAFGFELAERFREKHDHIVVELQFVALLLVLLGRASKDRLVDQREVTRKAIRNFLSDHLGAWLGPFSERLQSVATEELYGSVGELLAHNWYVLRRSFDLDEVHDSDTVTEDEGTPYECGMCPGDDQKPIRIHDRT